MAKLDWARHIRAQKKSGLSPKDYCESVGLNLRSFYSTRSKLRSKMANKKNPSFVPVLISEREKDKEISVKLSLSEEGNLTFTGTTNDTRLLSLLWGGGLS